MNASEVLDYVARGVWSESNAGDCRPDRIPAEADLTAWLGHNSPDLQDAAALLAAILPTPEGSSWG